MQFLARNSSSSATARAAPSSGAVPVPISSTSTREFGVAASSMVFKFSMWAEKVDKSAAIDCSSPMSTRTRSKSGSTACCAATGIPDCAASAAIPVVFCATVLPPVFGPLMTSTRSSPPRVSVMGNGAIFLAEFVLQHRMARAFQTQFIRCRKLGHRGVKFPRESRPCKHAIKLRNGPCSSEERPADHLQFLSELAQNPQNFRSFILGKLHQLVVGFDGFERLQEDRLPRRAGSVHHAGNAPPMLGTHGNHEAIVSQQIGRASCRERVLIWVVG